MIRDVTRVISSRFPLRPPRILFSEIHFLNYFGVHGGLLPWEDKEKVEFLPLFIFLIREE